MFRQEEDRLRNYEKVDQKSKLENWEVKSCEFEFDHERKKLKKHHGTGVRSLR
jgi:hypothetical protein